MIHALKTIQPYFEDVFKGNKNFELRKFDRPFKVGETILIQEFNSGQYTGREEERIITYILSDCPEFGLKKGYCILGLKEKEPY